MSQTSAEYADVRAALTDLNTALTTAIDKDAAEAERWWGAEFWDWLTNSEYQQQKKNFNDQADVLIKRAKDAVTSSSTILTAEFFPHRNAPKRLMEDSSDWRSRSSDARDLAASLGEMSPVDGWSGPAAEDYDRAVRVQKAAVVELQGVMQSAANGALRGAILNKALFAIARNAIKDVHSQANLDIPGGNGYFYLRTARWGDYLIRLPDVLQKVSSLENVQEAISVLNQQLGQSISMAQLLQDGEWPSGIDAADIVPANTGSAVTGSGVQDTDWDIPDSETPGVCSSGVHRG